MKLKSYFSGTVEAAMELARKELGEEALLVNARPATPETRYLGAYEVVFGLIPSLQPTDPAATALATKQVAAKSSIDTPRDMTSAPSSLPQIDRLAQDVDHLRREIARMSRSLCGPKNSTSAAPNPSSDLYERLISNELDAVLARAVAGGTPLESLFEVDSSLGRNGAFAAGGCAIVALVGPPGVGKTTTLVKLAARYALTSRKPAHIVSTDVYRIAAADQLRSFASILGVGCDVVETPLALAQAIEEHRSKGWIFIDTPGLAYSDMKDARDLACMIAGHLEIDTHLVLSASMKPPDMTRIAESYAIFAPKKLLFTRIDETESYGALLSEAARQALPISFLSSGQRIPDDLEPACKERLSAMILGERAKTEVQHSVGATA